MEETLSLSSAMMSHPSRAAVATRLSELLSNVPIVLDPAPHAPANPLRAAVAAWRAHTQSATHHLVVQDDITPAPNFLEEVKRAIRLFPTSAIAFYTCWDGPNSAAVRLAVLAGCDWVKAMANDYFPTQAMVMPTALIEDYLDLAVPASKVQYEDDEVMADFLRVRNIPAVLSAPSRVNHGDIESTMAHRFRRAGCFATIDQIPGGDRIATDIRMVPLFARGVAYCLNATDSSSSHGWTSSHWSGMIERWGYDASDIRSVFEENHGHVSKHTDESKTELLFNLWMSALLMSAVCHSQNIAVQNAVGWQREEVRPSFVPEAFRTMIQGAVMSSMLATSDLTAVGQLTSDLVLDGYERGKALNPALFSARQG